MGTFFVGLGWKLVPHLTRLHSSRDSIRFQPLRGTTTYQSAPGAMPALLEMHSCQRFSITPSVERRDCTPSHNGNLATGSLSAYAATGQCGDKSIYIGSIPKGLTTRVPAMVAPSVISLAKCACTSLASPYHGNHSSLERALSETGETW